VIETCYTALEWVELKNLGTIAAVYFEGTTEHWNPEELKGKRVIIDGSPYVVRGVDMYRHMISPERPYRATIGLLV